MVGAAAICLGCTSEGASSTGHPSSTAGVPAGEFGGLVPAGSLSEIRSRIGSYGLVYVAEARTYLVGYPADRVVAAKATYPRPIHAGLDLGLLALFQKCTHRGCRIPYCPTAGEFQCPCHGGVYSGVGEYRSGPPPRGLDLFALRVVGDAVAVDTRTLISGLARTSNPSQLTPTGESCIS